MRKGQILLVLFGLGLVWNTFSQDLSAIKNIDVASLSDEQIANYWEAIKEKGYTLAQLDEIAKIQGIPASKVAEFKTRVNNLKFKETQQNKVAVTTSVANMNKDPFGIKDGQIIKKNTTKSLLFGYDFFNNSEISFTPNMNIAVPDSYQLGPGDEVTIDLYGASEITYKAAVNKSGSIQISGLGFIYVNGLTLDTARTKITNALRKKHSGIAAPQSSYEKIFTNIVVSKIRTVQVSIIGEIKTPGTYAINSLATMLNAIYVAGGPTKMGSFRSVELIRNNKKIADLDIYDYLLSGKTNTERLQDQDVLLVKPYHNLITVEGAVKRPGIYELKEGQTLQHLSDYFGGFTPNSYTNLFVLERLVDGKEKEVKEVTLAEAASFEMKAGDKLIVQESLDIFKNKVTLNGEVYRPGNFELTPKMTLKDVIQKADGVTKDAFLPRGLLVRTYDNFTKENIPFSITAVMDGTSVIELQKDDEILIFNKKDLKEERTITVSGAVNKPSTLDYVDKLQIEDVIALAGGLKEGADPENITISRRLKDGSYETLSQVFTISSSDNLTVNNGTPFYLQPFDDVEVRYAKGYTNQQRISVLGQVAFPGGYVITDRNYRISDAISAAGGLTSFAFMEGSTLKRNGKLVGINLEAILKSPKSKNDLFLREGDVLNIPAEVQTIEVTGQVYTPSLIAFKEEKSLKYYIENSGGFTFEADKSKLSVQYLNGEIKTVKRFLFFKSYPKLQAGAKIVVPTKPERKKLSTQEILGITTSIGTLGILIQTLTR